MAKPKNLQPRLEPAAAAARFEQIADSLKALRANGFQTTTEACVFLAAANATLAGNEIDLGQLAELTEIPYTSVSRVAWDLVRRGMLEYSPDATDRRRKIVRAKVEAFQ